MKLPLSFTLGCCNTQTLTSSVPHWRPERRIRESVKECRRACAYWNLVYFQAEGVESDLEHRSDGDGDWIGGRRGRKDGTTSGAHHNSKRVERRPLATEEAHQQRRYGRCVKNVPRSSMAPSKHPRHPIALPNPLRRRGRLKSRTRKIKRSTMRRSTHQVVPPCRGQSGCIERIGYVAYTAQRLGEHPTATMNEKDCPSDDRGACSRVRQRQ